VSVIVGSLATAPAVGLLAHRLASTPTPLQPVRPAIEASPPPRASGLVTRPAHPAAPQMTRRTRVQRVSPSSANHPNRPAAAPIGPSAPPTATDAPECPADCPAIKQKLMDAAVDPRGASRLAGADRIDTLEVPPSPPPDSCGSALMGPSLCHAVDSAAGWVGDHKFDVASTVGMLALQAVPVLDVAADAAAAVRTAEAVGDGTSFAEAQGLRRALASDAQIKGPGEAIAGRGTSTRLRDASRLSSTYGGEASGWRKMTSTSFEADTVRTFETHWYENAVGERFEPKVKLTGPWVEDLVP
jgi:hypothetical protein